MLIRRAVPGLAVLLAAVGMACCWNLTTVGAFNDDACYILQARHLLDGIDYGALQHLPGQALVLLPAVALFPASQVAIRLEAVLLTLAAVVTWWRLGLRFLDPLSAALLGAVFACNPLAWKMGSTGMSDVPFALLVPLLLLLQLRSAPAWLIGLGTGLAVLCRAPGVLLAAVLVGEEVYRKDGRRVARLLGGVAAMLLVGQLLFGVFHDFASYANDGSQLLVRTSPAVYLAAWGRAMAGALGEFVGFPALWGLAAVAVPAGLAMARRAPLLGAFAWFYAALLVTWAYVEPRFIWPVWPLFLLLALVPLAHRVRVGLLSLLLILNLAQLPSLYRIDRQAGDILPRRWASLDWLAQHAAGETVIASAHYFVMLRGHVHAVRQFSDDLCDVLEEAVAARASYIYVDPTLAVSTQVTQGKDVRLDLWLDRSTLVQRVFDTPWDRVYRVTAAPGPFMAAWQHWLAGDPQAALRACPDLPCARAELARRQLLSNRAEGEATLVGLVRQYPMDVDSVLRLAEAWRQDGRTADAAHLLSEAAALARQQGRDADAARLSGF